MDVPISHLHSPSTQTMYLQHIQDKLRILKFSEDSIYKNFSLLKLVPYEIVLLAKKLNYRKNISNTFSWHKYLKIKYYCKL